MNVDFKLVAVILQERRLGARGEIVNFLIFSLSVAGLHLEFVGHQFSWPFSVLLCPLLGNSVIIGLLMTKKFRNFGSYIMAHLHYYLFKAAKIRNIKLEWHKVYQKSRQPADIWEKPKTARDLLFHLKNDHSLTGPKWPLLSFSLTIMAQKLKWRKVYQNWVSDNVPHI